jgi:hypothetical protein
MQKYAQYPSLEASLPKDQNGFNGQNGLEWQSGFKRNYHSGLDASTVSSRERGSDPLQRGAACAMKPARIVLVQRNQTAGVFLPDLLETDHSQISQKRVQKIQNQERGNKTLQPYLA